MINFEQFEILSFDCYGTLIDWESGILNALKPILLNHAINISDQEILELFAQIESNQESSNYLNYREILKVVVQEFGKKLNFEPTEIELNVLPDSIQQWEPFSDTVKALKALKKRYKLTIISFVENSNVFY